MILLRLMFMAGSILGLLGGAVIGWIDIIADRTGFEPSDSLPIKIMRWVAAIGGTIGLIAWLLTFTIFK